MPQLDANTFLAQYLVIASVLIIVYTTLSYVILPILLRLMLVRNNFLALVNSVSNTSSVSAISTPLTSAQLRVYEKSVYVNRLLNKILLKEGTLGVILFKLVQRVSVENNVNSQLSYSNTVGAFLYGDSSLLMYLIMFLILDSENE